VVSGQWPVKEGGFEMWWIIGMVWLAMAVSFLLGWCLCACPCFGAIEEEDEG
jgi:hypothetical protein